MADRTHGNSVWIETENEMLQKQWDIMVRRLELDNLWLAIAYNLAHMGEVFFYNAIKSSDKPQEDPDKKTGIEWMLYDEPENVEVMLGERREPTGYKSLDIVPEDAKDGLLKLYEFTHFRMITRSLLTSTGDSLLSPVRKIWRMLKMMEDAMVIYRLVKGPNRYVYNIDIGNQRPEDAAKTIQAYKQNIRRRSYINAQTGQFDERWLGISVEEDIYWPVRPGSASKVDLLQGANNLPHIDDIEYLRKGLYAGLNMPTAFFESGEGIRGRALAMMDKLGNSGPRSEWEV